MVLGGRHPYMNRRKVTEEPTHSVISGPLRTLELAMQQAEARKAESYRRGTIPARPTLVTHGPIRILVSGAPDPGALDAYARTLNAYNVKRVVRACEPTYDADRLRELGFELHDMPFPDGQVPPPHAVSEWLTLLDEVFRLNRRAERMNSAQSAASDASLDLESGPSSGSSMDEPVETVAVHCIAGLGRAPVLAAIALVELGLDPYEAIGYIRVLRRGAINATQVVFLESYTRRPPPTAAKVTKVRSRSGNFVGAFWPTWKAARPFRPRSPVSRSNSPLSPQRSGGMAALGMQSPL